jgi:hypothetical protein
LYAQVIYINNYKGEKMKTLRTLLAISAVLLLVISFGCSKKEDPVEPTPDTNVTTQQGYATSALDMTDNVFDFTAGLSGGLSGWNPPLSSKGNTQKIDTTVWIGPTTHSNHFNLVANDGWYYNPLDTIYHITVWAKFSPNRVIDSNAIVTRIDWEYNWDMDSIKMEYSAYAAEITGTDRVNAGWYCNLNSGLTTAGIYWECILDSITTTGWGTPPKACSGSFELVNVYTTTTTDTLTKVNLNFNSGSGTGSLWYLGTELVKYTFNNDGTGYYCVAADGFVQKYTFTW